MAYTALEKMREANRTRFGTDLGPMQPELHAAEDACDMKSAALRFLHTRCEQLCFDPGKAAQEAESGEYFGTSTKPGQIPYNMQMDLNRLCLERELEKFIDSGVAEDAYTVYYCYLQMFFGGYAQSKKMVELLSEFESNGSSLLMKHRDHYSHSVYVFALGLAVYETNEPYRREFREFYRDVIEEAAKAGAAPEAPEANMEKADPAKETEPAEAAAPNAAGVSDSAAAIDRAAAHLFLEYWGLTSLFHDIGYPFELPFEQVLSYFEVDDHERGEDTLYLAFKNPRQVTTLKKEETDHFRNLYHEKFRSTNELFAHDIAAKLGEDYDINQKKLAKLITSKPRKPEKFGYFMDHAWFSAVRLYRELVRAHGIENINERHIDALSAILLHNSLYKFAIADYKSEDAKKPLPMDLHPLAYLLMLCDELQCWDRIAYGRNSRTELHPMDAKFDFTGNAIDAVYYYDIEEREKINDFKKVYHKWEEDGEQGEAPRLKAYSDMAEKEQRFTADILRIVNTAEIPLTVKPDEEKVDRSVKHTYLSDSNFLHLFDFAVALNGRYNYQGKEKDLETEQLEADFEMLSLEYQLSNINQAKSFSRYLDALDCFYTDRPVDYEMITEFTPEFAEAIAPMEHERWIWEHINMGWRKGDEYNSLPLGAKAGDASEAASADQTLYVASNGAQADQTLDEEAQKAAEAAEKAARKTLREQLRRHELAMDGAPTEAEIREHYDHLPENEQDKDWKPFNSMLYLIRLFDGLRIYRLGMQNKR